MQPVTVDADVFGVRTAVRRISADLGFGRVAQAELVIVASELASNILKYGRRGEVAVRAFYDESGRAGIEIAARDRGPPIRDFVLAQRDGFTDEGPIDPALLLRRRGIGAGLGAVARLSDRVHYRAEDDGKTIIAQRYLRRASWRPPRRAG